MRIIRTRPLATRSLALALAAALAGSTHAIHAATGTWNLSTGGTWNNPANWAGSLPDAISDTAIFDSALLSSGSITLDAASGSRTLGSVVFNNSAASYTLVSGTGGSLLLNNGTNGAASIAVALGSHAIAAPLQLASNLSINAVAGTSLLLSGNISGSGVLANDGAGSLTLTGNNTFNHTELVAGTLIVGSAGALGAGSVIFDPGSSAALRYALNAPATFDNSISGAGSVTIAGPAPVTFRGQNLYGGTTTLLPNTQLIADYSVVHSVVISYGSPTVLMAGSAITLLGAASASCSQLLPSPLTMANNSSFNMFAGVGGSLFVGGTSTTLNLTGATSFNLNAGVDFQLRMPTPNGLTSFNVGSGGSLTLSNSFPAYNLLGSIDFTGTGRISFPTGNAAGTILSPYYTFNGRDWATSVGGLLSPLSSYTPDTWSGGDTTVTTNSFIADATANSLRFAAPSAHTVTLSGVNVLSSGGILVTPDVGANTSTIAGGTLRSASNPPGLNSSQKDLVLNQMNTSGDLLITSLIQNDLALTTNLTKIGPGTAIIAGTNVVSSPGTILGYTGTTRIDFGTLKIGNVTALSRGPVTINSNGILDLNGFSQTVGPLSTSNNAGVIDNFGGGNVTLTSFFAGFQGGFSGSIRNTTGTTNVVFTGTGFVNFFGANTYSGTTTVHRTAITLAFNQEGAPTSNILPATTTLILQGDSFAQSNNGNVNVSQSLAGLLVDAGASTLTLGSTSGKGSLLNLGSISRNAGGTINFVLQGAASAANQFTTTASNDPSGILGAWATMGNTWAANIGGVVSPFADNNAPNTFAPGVNTRLTTSLAPTSSSAATLTFLAGANTLTLSGTTTLESGGILVTSGVANSPIIIGGSITSGNGHDLIVTENQSPAGPSPTLVIASPIVNNGATPIGLTKSGAANLVLATVNSYTGPTYVNAGNLRFQAGSSIDPTSVIHLESTLDNAGNLTLFAGQTLPNSVIATIGSNEPFSIDSAGTATFSGSFTVPADSPDQYRMGVAAGSLVLTGTHTIGSANTSTAAVTALITRGNITFAGSAQLNVFNTSLQLGSVNNVNLTITDNAVFNSNVDPGVEAVTVTSPGAFGSMTTLTLSGNALFNLGSSGAGIFNLHAAGAGTTINLSGNSQIDLGGFTLPSGSATLNFDGGTIVAGMDNPNFIPNLNVKTNLKAGGLTINTNGHNITSNMLLLHDTTLGTTPDGGLTKLGAGTLLMAGRASYSGPTTISSGTLQFSNSTTHSIAGVSGPGMLEIMPNTGLTSDGVSAGRWLIDANATQTIRSNGSTAGASSLSGLALSIAGAPMSAGGWTGKLDLTNNALVLTNADTTAKATEISLLQDQILSGRNGGTWDGKGITSSSIPTTPDTTLALIDNADSHLTSFRGVTGLNDDSIIVVQAVAGDTNLNGTVDFNDLLTVAQHFGQTGTGWGGGDFDGSGVVNFADLLLVAQNFGQSQSLTAAAGASAGAVPEPGTIGLLGIGGLMLLRKKKKRHLDSSKDSHVRRKR